LPLFGFFAGPFKFFYVAAFAVQVLAGIGLVRLRSLVGRGLRVAAAAIALVAMPGLGLATWIAVAGAAVLPLRCVRIAVLVVVFVAAAGFLRRSDAIGTPQPFSRDAFTPLLRASPADGAAGDERWIALDETDALRQMGMNFGALWGLDAVSGVGPLPPWREFEVLGGAERGSAPALIEQVGASRVVVRKGSGLERQLLGAGLGTTGSLDGLSVLAVPAPSPRVFLARTVEHVDAATAVDAARRGRALDPDHVLVEAEPTGTSEVGDPAGRLELVASSASDYRMLVDVARPTWIVVRAAYYRNWRATLDGAPVDVHPAGGLFLAVRAEAGRHEVGLAYREPGLVPGLVVAALTAIGLVMVRRRDA